MNIKTKSKVKTLEELEEICRDLRERNKKIVHCHGVFDLLHVGHIKHFEEAASFGDILVVTITEDQFVNKGPHRPAFTSNLRLDFLASIEVIDYVAVSTQPQSIYAIKTICPHFYVKGADYKNMEKDLTGGIYREKTAVEAGGGQLVFTDDIVFSSSQLINRYISSFPKEVNDYLSCFSQRHPQQEIFSYFPKIKALKVLVLGESIIDIYQYCRRSNNFGFHASQIRSLSTAKWLFKRVSSFLSKASL